MQLTPDDCRLIDESIDRHCRDLAAGCFARPEMLASAADFRAACQRFAEQGVLNVTADEGGGLWEDCDAPGNLAFTLDTLATLGATNAALALVLHRAALARHLLDRLHGCPEPVADISRLALCLHGRHGLGRGELARWWQDRDPDLGMLSDVFDRQGPRLALMADNSGGVLCPVFEGGMLQWWLVPAPAPLDAQHGLDELRTAGIRPAGGELLALADAATARALARDVWHREWLGLLAIGQGVARQALARATDHAALRVQGGTVIARHAAVQALLGSLRSAQAETGAFLAAQRLDSGSFGRLLLARNRLQDGLADAVNAAMQIFGGSGYMRDGGLEKCFRDFNQLRYQSGGPLDMQLLASHWSSPSEEAA